MALDYTIFSDGDLEKALTFGVELLFEDDVFCMILLYSYDGST